MLTLKQIYTFILCKKWGIIYEIGHGIFIFNSKDKANDK